MCRRFHFSCGAKIIAWLRQKWLMQQTNSARRIFSSTRQYFGSKNSAGPCIVKLNVNPPSSAASIATEQLELEK